MNKIINDIIIVGGGKGGVGKSTINHAVIDMLMMSAGQKVICVDTDNSNPDVSKCVQRTVETYLYNIDVQDGYVDIGAIIENKTDSAIVINTGARSTNGLIENGYILSEVAKEMDRKIIVLWPINEDKDCIELLADYFEGSKDYNSIYVLKNTYFGNSFFLYENSNIKDKVSGTITFPNLSHLITPYITNKRLALWELEEEKGFRLAEKSVLYRFRNEVKKSFNGVLYE
ncbi:AAA family ATPase [Desulfonatronum thioautotrophicum]|uniref:AAA family ATPase n=1 Tax=Desulfonatronum thioautotrophicum TaxID=617001 RepID=UPI0005EB10CC|nr:AAA family ATPase [Desulfonatronum thioautotrophicum]